MGRISSAITNTPVIKTPIQVKLQSLGMWLVGIAMLLCALNVCIGMAWGHALSELLKTSMALAVSVIPEGLVAVVTVAMAMGVRRMAAKNAIVRKLPCVESLGSVTVICSDKTGTLTEGKMGACEMWTTDGVVYKFTESTNLNPQKGQVLSNRKGSSTPLVYSAPAPHFKCAVQCMSFCNNSSVVPDSNAPDDFKAIGDPTEVALTVAAQKAGFGTVDASKFVKVKENAFDSVRKLMSVAYRVDYGDDSDVIIFAKGAPEALFKRSTTCLEDFEGSAHFFDWDPRKISDKAVNLTPKHLSDISAQG
jgi:Ca2+-transporting ATPase